MLEELAGGGITGALDILGGQLSAAQNRQAQRASADLQREFAQHGIQWRVEDAKAAGLHPLAALGMSPVSASPIAIGDVGGEGFSKAGQSVGAAVTRAMSTQDKAMENAQLRLLQSQAEESDARRFAIMSDIGLKSQNAGISNGLGIQPEGSNLPDGQVPNVPLGRAGSGMIDIKPAPQISTKAGEPHIQAGLSPDLEEVEIAPGMNMLMPAARGQESTWEVWSELPWYEKISMLMRNSKFYGEGWMSDYLRVKGGYAPEGQYKKRAPEQFGPPAPTKFQEYQQWLKDTVDKTVGGYREYKKRYKRWSKKHPSGRG